jgi:hypothetical protein
LAAGFFFVDLAAFFGAAQRVLQPVFFAVAMSYGSFCMGVLVFPRHRASSAQSRDAAILCGRTSKPNLSGLPRLRGIGHLLDSPKFAH